MNRRRAILAMVVMGLLSLTICFRVWAKPDEGHGRKTVRPSLTQLTRLSLGDSEFEIPANATDREISAEMVEPDLEGISKPYRFRAVSKVYRFGPHGLKFNKGKEIQFSIRLSEENEKAKLYYINRETKRLELVSEQKNDRKNRVLKGKLKHFSEYVLGITPGWDGNGINPFFDIIHGEETVQTTSLTLSVRSNVISLPGRGINFILTRASGDTAIDELKISDNWYWDLPYVQYRYIDNKKVNIPGKGAFDLGVGDGRINSILGYELYNYEGAYYAVKTGDENGEYDSTVYFNDGTCVSTYLDETRVTDSNGNSYRYGFQHIGDSESSFEGYRISWLEDSAGRYFTFDYDNNGVLNYVKQRFKNGQVKTILTLTYYNSYQCFIDALGRRTLYKGKDVGGHWYFSEIVYPNGAWSEYCYDYCYYAIESNYIITQQRFFKSKNENEPYRTVYYNREGEWIIVNDGNKISKYKCTGSESIDTELVYSLSGQLICRKDYTYYPERYDSDMIKSVTTTYATSSGTLDMDSSSTYQYEYDNWGNITRVIDPYGTETWTTYANTNSGNMDLSLINPKYKKSLYTSTFTGWNKPITKATLIKNPLDPNNPKLKQTHYQYDSKGNLLKESEAYGNSHLHTTYTYDRYGNVLTKTDSNGKTLAFEYSPIYNNAYLTRVYKPDTQETIATYEYNFDTGNKIKATDPNGNVFRYEYDTVNRLTKEWQESTDPVIAISRIIQYDDLNNVVILKYGNDTLGYQAGRIEYDPLWGKPIKLQRYKGLVAGNAVLSATDSNWVTQKVIEYGTNGLIASEKTWEKENLPPHITSYQYDELDRKTSVTHPNGAMTRYEYDDRKVTIFDANGNKKEQQYDLLDRLIRVDEYPGPNESYITRYVYDSYYDSGSKPAYHLVKVINPKNAETVYTYDNLGRLLRTDYPQNLIAAEIYTYDNVGNLKTRTNGKGTKTIEYEYFAGYRPKTVTEPDGRVVSYTYDKNDNPLTQTINGVTYKYQYDARNRVKTFTAKLDGREFIFEYDYNAFGQMVGMKYPGRTEWITYIYDELDRLQTIPGFVTSCSYDGENKLTEMALANGMYNTFSYDVNSRPVNIGAITEQGQLMNLDYGYDPVGNILRINGDYYKYDGLNRLVWSGNVPTQNDLYGKTYAYGKAWSYDGAGNMTGKQTYQNGQLQQSETLGYDLANQLLNSGAATYTNSIAGERLTKTNGSESWIYQYDGESRLKSVSKNNALLAESYYDGAGMRYKKVSNGKTTYPTMYTVVRM